MNPIAVKPENVGPLLDLGKTTIYRLIADGVIPTIQIPGVRGVRVPLEGLRERIKQLIEEQSTE